MLKQGAQKGGPKGENKWLKHQSDRAGSIQMQFATFHENSKYHRKCLYFGSHFRSFLVPFSRLFPKSGPRGTGPHPKVLKARRNGPQGYPNGAQGCQNEGPWSPHCAEKPPNYTPCVLKWKPKVPQWSPKATQSAKETPQGPAKCHKDNPQVPTSTTRHERIA